MLVIRKLYDYCRNRIKITAVLLTAILVGFFCVDPVFAVGSESKVVKVGYYANDNFQEGAYEGGTKRGYCYDYLQKIATITGWKYEYVYGTWSDIYAAFLRGEVDLLGGLAYSPERAELFHYSARPMGAEHYYLFKSEANTVLSDDLATIDGSKLGTVSGNMEKVLRRWIAENNLNAEVYVFRDFKDRDAALQTGEIDAFIGENDGTNEKKGNVKAMLQVGETDYYMTIAKNRPDLLKEFNHAQEKLHNRDARLLSNLWNRYYRNTAVISTLSAEENNWLKQHDTIRVGYLKHYLPLSGTDEAGKVTGAIKDIIPEMLKGLRIELTPVYIGYDDDETMLKELKDGHLDLIFPIYAEMYSSEKYGIFQSSDVMTVPVDFVYLDTFSEKSTEKIAVVKNNLLQTAYVQSYYPKAQIIVLPTIRDCLAAVYSGAATGTITNGLRTDALLRNQEYSSLKRINLPDPAGFAFGVRFGETALFSIIDRGIAVMDKGFPLSACYGYDDLLTKTSLLGFIKDHLDVVFGFMAVIIVLIGIALSIYILGNKEQVRINAELQKAIIAAEQASKAKTVFLNNMAHDIRTPMNAIIGFTSLATSHIENTEQVTDYLGKISISSKHLLSLINDVLDMSRIESGKVKIEETSVHWPDILHDLRTIVQSDMCAHELELSVKAIDITDEDIVIDKLRLDQVLLNLLSNAMKFTKAGGSIGVSVAQKPAIQAGYAAYEIRVSDTGIGMSPEFLEHIFEPFTREETSTVSGIQGTGLGMSITKNIIDLMHGTIAVESEAGKGSTFVINIEAKISEDKADYSIPDQFEGAAAMVVEADEEQGQGIVKLFERIGMRAEWAGTGQEAREKLQTAAEHGKEYRAVVVDWQIGDINNLDLIRQVRQSIGPDKAIIVLTVYDWSGIEKEAVEAGATAFCTKPLFASELCALLAKKRLYEPKKESPALEFTDKKILLVEDNELNQEIATAILTEAGFEVDIADDGTVAVEKVKQARKGDYDLILMDIQMPQMNGFDATRAIRKLDAELSGIPIFAMTANVFEEDKQAAIDAGMNGFIAKPIDMDSLFETLRQALG